MMLLFGRAIRLKRELIGHVHICRTNKQNREKIYINNNMK